MFRSAVLTPPSDAVRVAVVEDSRETRVYLETLIENEPRLELTQSYGDLESALAELSLLAPQVVILDLRLPGKSGIEGIGLIKKILPDSHVLIFTVSEDEDNVFKAIKSGADGYLLKRFTREEIVESILVVHQGGSPVSPTIARKILHSFRKAPPAASRVPQRRPLSSQQQSILELLAKGWPLKLIAEELDLSALTVRWHLRNIYKILQVHSQAQAVVEYLKVERSGGIR